MRRIVCDECRKIYDNDRDEFCPKCGAFNQPVKTWTTDAQGNVRRVDGVNEANHAGSFVHSEVHKEKRVRQAKGMDWDGGKRDGRQQPPARTAPPQPRKQKKDAMWIIKAAFIMIAAAMLIAWILPWISLFL